MKPASVNSLSAADTVAAASKQVDQRALKLPEDDSAEASSLRLWKQVRSELFEPPPDLFVAKPFGPRAELDADRSNGHAMPRARRP